MKSAEIRDCFSIHVPPITRCIQYDLSNMQNIVIYDPALPTDGMAFFHENTTTLVVMRVNRLSIDHIDAGPEPSQH
jgi:hypothetical protein